MFNFPNSPTLGQKFTPPGGVEYTWDGKAWKIVVNTSGGSSAVTSVNSQIGDVVLDYADVGAAAAIHTHPISDVTNLQTTLDGKAATVHSHVIGDVTGLQTALDGKAPVSHTHTLPAATVAALGGVYATANPGGQFVNGVNASGQLTYGTPAGSAYTLPAASTTALGGVFATANPGGQFVTGITSTGALTYGAERPVTTYPGNNVLWTDPSTGLPTQSNNLRFNNNQLLVGRADFYPSGADGIISCGGRIEAVTESGANYGLRMRANSINQFAALQCTSNNGGAQWTGYGSTGQNLHIFWDGSALNERMRITDTFVGINTTGKTGGGRLGIVAEVGENGIGIQTRNNGNAGVAVFRSDSAECIRLQGDGSIFAMNTNLNQISDARHKENVRDLDAGLDEVMALLPRRFDWKEGRGRNIKNDMGFIAQEFETVFPELVETWGTDKTVAAVGIIPALVRSIHQLVEKLEDAQARIEILEGK